MARRRKKNPEGGATGLLVIGGIAVVGYFAYINNWLSGLGLPSSTTTPTTGPITGPVIVAGTSTSGGGTSAPGGGAAPPPVPLTPTPVPPIGTVVHTAADLAGQVAANLYYILPDSTLIGQPPSGYTLAADQTPAETGTSNGQFYMRNDVANATIAAVNALGAMTNAASGGSGFVPITLSTLYQYPIQNLAQLQTIISNSKGLSGLGFTRSRSVFPFNPIMGGVDILNAPRGWH